MQRRIYLQTPVARLYDWLGSNELTETRIEDGGWGGQFVVCGSTGQQRAHS